MAPAPVRGRSVVLGGVIAPAPQGRWSGLHQAS
jgi:hypothetical protein